MVDPFIQGSVRSLLPPVGAAGFPTIRRRFLTQGNGRLGWHATSGRLDQPVGKVLLLPAQPLEQPMPVIILLSAQLVADAPDFFDGILVSRGRSWLRRAATRFLRRWHQAVSMFGLLLLQVDNHPVQVVVKPGCQLFAHPPDAFQEIVLHTVGFNISSLGVQITGISNPACRQVAANWPPVAALAR